MQVYCVLLCLVLILQVSVLLLAKLEPTTYAYKIDYNGESCKNGVAGINIYPVYGSNGTCLQSSNSGEFDYMKIICGKDYAIINQMCHKGCQYCDDSETWKFNKNECGFQDVGCGSIPQLSTPFLYTSFFDYSQNDCKGNLVNIQGSSLNNCARITGHSYQVITCNQTMWTTTEYLHDPTCNPKNFYGSLSNPNNECTRSGYNAAQAIFSCEKLK